MWSLLSAAALFLVGLAALGGTLFRREKTHRILFLVAWAALWAGSAALLLLTRPTLLPPAFLESEITLSPEDVATATPIPEPSPTPAASTMRGIEGKVVFHSDRTGDFEIWVMLDDGSDPVQLTDSPGRDIEPAWSPDGSQIVFASARIDPDNLELFLMNADGSDQRPLMEPHSSDDLGPAWSPDGTKIAFHSGRDGRLDIFVVNVDGTNLTNLSYNLAGNDSRPAWSPDGTKIAFVSDRDGNNEIYVMDADGSNQRRLTDDVAYDVMPKWSPDGKTIVFESNRGPRYSLYLMDADGSNVRPALAHLQEDATPGWGNDGRRIYFSTLRDGSWQIYYRDLTTGDEVRLTTEEGYNRFPDWKPLNMD